MGGGGDLTRALRLPIGWTGLLALLLLALFLLDRSGAMELAPDQAENGYPDLRADLAAGDWRRGTLTLSAHLLETVDRHQEGWFDREAVDTFPCPELVYLDAMLVRASAGRFGFTPQREVLEALAAASGTAPESLPLADFASAVGWRRPDGTWLAYDELDFDPASAPKGHLPVLVAPKGLQPPFKSRKGDPEARAALVDLLDRRLRDCAP